MNNDQHERWQASIGNETDRLQAKAAIPTVRNAAPAVPGWESRIILLVDSNPRTRESRAKEFRARGVIVHCAADANTARARTASAAYNLVLVDLGQDCEAAEKLVQEIRANNPRQRAAFLVGSPLYVASSLKRSSTQRARLPETASVLPTRKPEALSDFGQRVKDAEADASGKQPARLLPENAS
jgi:CheY-like chemotaxis protein